MREPEAVPASADWTAVPCERACALLETDPLRGLSGGEAARRLARDGPNRVAESRPPSRLRVLLRQFESPLILLLLPAGAAAAFLGEREEAVAIAAIVVLNAALAYFQERRSALALAALKRLSAPTSKVLRDGEVATVSSESVVRGDIVLLDAGDRVPADGRLLNAASFRTLESSLTGESAPVDKDPAALPAPAQALGDRSNMAFLGTVVVAGAGRMAVTGTGAGTELGAIASALAAESPEATPLERRLRQLGGRLAAVALAAAGVAAASAAAGGLGWYDVLLVAISLAVAAIPEGLPAVVTTGLALGVTRMARRHALIRKLPAVETLGCATVILTDKTGTLTRNEMTVRRVWTAFGEYEVTGAGYEPAGEFRRGGAAVRPVEERGLGEALEAASLASSAKLRGGEGGGFEVVGDPTEGALLVAASKAGLEPAELERRWREVGSVPFDGERKRMSSLRHGEGGRVLFVKGAPEAILSRAEAYWDGAEARPLGREVRERIAAAAARQAAEALRVIAVARRPFAETERLGEEAEQGLVFLGLLGMIDPPRLEVGAAVEACRRAGVRAVMVTGDHRETAAAVGRAIGLLDGGETLSGEDVDRLSDAELGERIERVAVFARLSAKHKTRLVKAWKGRGAVVAVTGDGVNDAPALLEADIGVAMGITGTDVAKQAADMVVTDDNFASIVSAMEEGRAVYDDIARVVNYLMSSNLAELLVVVVGLLAAWGGTSEAILPLTPVQILWINLVTDGLPALALIMDPLTPGAMSRPPRHPDEAILTGSTALRLVLVAALVAGGALAAFAWGLSGGVERARTMALTTLVCLEMARVHAVRWGAGLGAWSNPALMAALLASLGLQAAVVYWPPASRLLGTVPLTAGELAVVGAATAAGWAAVLLVERLARGRRVG